MKYFIYILLILCFSCRSKKKVTDRTFEGKKEIVKEQVDKKEKSTLDTDIRSNGVIITTSFIKNKTTTFTQANPDNEIQITDPDGSVTKIKGANFTTSNKEETKKIVDSFQTLLKTQVKEMSVLRKANESLSKSIIKSRESNSKASGVSTGLWLWLVFLVLLILILWRLGLFKRFFIFVALLLFMQSCVVSDSIVIKRYEKILYERNCLIQKNEKEIKALKDSIKAISTHKARF